MFSAVNKMPVIHNKNNIAAHGGGDPLGNYQLGAPCSFFRKLCAKVCFRKEVKGGKAVVKNINRSILDDCTSDGKPLFLPAGEVFARLIKLVVITVFKS